MKSGLKFEVKICIFCVSIVLLWLLVFNIKSMMLEKEIESMQPNNQLEEENSATIESIRVYINDEFIDLQDLKDYDYSSNDIVDVEITYSNNSVAKRHAYISVNTDSDEVEVTYEDGEYGHIKVPMSKEENK